MIILRSTCFLGRLAVGIRSQSLLNILHSQVRCVNMKITKAEPSESFTYEQRNTIAGRPLSPFYIYKPQLTSLMSISHRLTGMMLSGCVILLATASFLTSDMANVAHIISDYGFPGFIIFYIKMMLGFPAVYHLCNGTRHLLWDIGVVLNLKDVYTGGYITLAVAGILAFFVAI